MTGLVRKAMLFGVFGLLAGSAALANVPDCGMSTVPAFIFVGGYDTGVPYSQGLDGPPFPPFYNANGSDGIPNNNNVIIIKDAFGSPISNVGVHIKFPCDINLCSVQPLGATSTADGDGFNSLHGVTGIDGRFTFLIIGSSKDPGAFPNPSPWFPIGPPFRTFPGGGLNSTTVTVDGAPAGCIPFKRISTVAQDLDGNISTSEGTDGLDVSKQLNASLTMVASGNPSSTNIYYRARTDQEADGDVDGLDVSIMLGHALVILPNQSGCGAPNPGTYHGKNACPAGP